MRPGARCADNSTDGEAEETALKTPTPGAASETCVPVLENDARAPVPVRRRDREPATADALRADRLQQRRRVLDRRSRAR